MSFIQELKRRNVFRVAIAYIITTWLLLQVADVVLGNIGAPDWVFKTIMLVLALGFPLALLLAWAFELTPEGIKKEKDVDRSKSVTRVTGRKLDFTIIALLALGLVYFVWESRFSAESTTGAQPPLAAAGTGADESGQEPIGEADGESGLASNNAAGKTTGAGETANRKSIAALPFSTRSSLEDDQYFSDGMHDDLLTQLAKIGDMKVISRTSVMEYRDTTKNLRQIGEELGVATILEGAIQRSGNQVRINVQLIDAETDEHLWAEIFDRELTAENLFAIQSEIALAIATALHATLSPEEQQRLEQPVPTENLEALKAYRLARLQSDELAEEYLARAEEAVERAIELDPGFAEAWALQARIQLGFHWNVQNDDERVAKAWQAIEKGRALNPELVDLDIAEGYYWYWGFRNYDRAIGVLEPIFKMYPNNSQVHRVLGFVYRRQGNIDAALERLHRALELEPRSVEVAVSLAETYTWLRDADRAREYLQVAEAINPLSSRYLMQSGLALYGLDGDPESAARTLEIVEETVPFDFWRIQAAMGDYGLDESYDYFAGVWALGNVDLTPNLMHGLSLRLAGEISASKPILDLAITDYQQSLVAEPDDFRYLKPLCLAHGARINADRALEVCDAALQNLPDDQFDRNLHRTDIAGGLAMAGLKSEALNLIEDVITDRGGPSRTEMQLDPMLRTLHDQPRWQTLMGPPDSK